MTASTIPLEQYIAENSQLKKTIESLTGEVSQLKEQLEWFRRQIFGQKSEKIVALIGSEQLSLPLEFPPKPEEEIEVIPPRLRKKPNRDGQDKITLPEDLPTEQHIIDLPESEKICPVTGKPLVKIGEEITQKLAYKPGRHFIKKIIRPKYASPADPDAGVKTAFLPEALLTRCQADESFLADLLVKKFADHLPLYRQSEILAREGISISRQILSQWVIRSSLALKPLYNEMSKQVLKSDNIFFDETPLDMLAPGKGKTHQAYMWVLVGGKAANPAYRIYNFRTNRCHRNAEEILKGYRGVLHSDKYGAYETLANQKQFIWCPCWAHIRRKFFDAEAGDPAFRAWVLRKMKYLFMLERVAWARSEEERLRIRQKSEVPIIDELINKIKERLVNGKEPRNNYSENLLTV